jgi:hypothetical protein
MEKLNIGDMVQMDGECECSPKPIKGEPIWFDVKDCYHKPNAVRHVFRDGRSAWVTNRYGYARRILNRDLIE